MTAIYHITHLENLGSILNEGGLCSDNRRLRKKLTCRGIAYEHIKARRAARAVPVSKKGVLADYVPFYFAPRSPMLFAIHGGFVPSYADGQNPVLHLVSAAETVRQAKLPFAFSDGHAEISYSAFYDDLRELKCVDWAIMRETYWRDTPEDGDRKRRRQAEFLVHDFVPWHLVHEIGVMDARVRAQVEQILRKAPHVPAVVVHRDWYY